MYNRLAQNRNAAGAIQQAMARNNAMRRPAMQPSSSAAAIPSPFISSGGAVGQTMNQMTPQMQPQQNMLMQMLMNRQQAQPQTQMQAQSPLMALMQLMRGR